MTEFQLITISLSGVQTLAIVAGFAIALWQLKRLTRDSHNTLELAARENALALISRYQDPAFIERRTELRDREDFQKDKYRVSYLLNFFEELAVSVKHKTANEALLKDFFRSILRLWLEEDWMVEMIRTTHSEDKSVFENLLWLYRRWETDRSNQLRINRIPSLS